MRIASEIPLPELLPWNGPAEIVPDLHFQYGEVPERLEGADYAGPVFQAKGDSYLLAIPGSPRCLVRGGREVLVQHLQEEEADPRSILTGTIQGVIYHLRGFVPLHASTVLIAGGAIAITAPSGTGKSTLAGALAERGFPVLGDDICVIQQDQRDKPHVLPTYPRLRLWRDAMDALHLNAQSFPRAIYGKEKYLVDRVTAAYPTESVPLRDIVLLVREPSRREHALARLKGLEAVQAISQNVHVRRPAAALGLQKRLFFAATKLAAHCRVWRLTRANSMERLEELSDTVANLPDASS